MITEKNIFFNSSMPRACSTLFQNILAQNPTIHGTATDGSLELLYGARANFTSSLEFKAQDSKTMLNAWRAFCYWGLQGYVNGLTEKENVCIKCRGIGIHYDWYKAFFGANGKEVKIICLVRDVREIFASMEKIFRSNQENHQPIQDHAKLEGTTTEKRVQIWANGHPIGHALERLSQMIKEGLDKNVLFIRAEDLTTNPEQELKRTYEYLKLPYYKHDFDNVKQFTVEDDFVYGLTSTLHKIREKIEPIKKSYKEVLGKEAANWLQNNFEWYQRKFNYN